MSMLRGRGRHGERKTTSSQASDAGRLAGNVAPFAGRADATEACPDRDDVAHGSSREAMDICSMKDY
jgi:hypothetical protein